MNTAIIILVTIQLLIDRILIRAYRMEVHRLEKNCDAYFDTLLKVNPSGEWVKIKSTLAKGLERRAGFWGFLTGR